VADFETRAEPSATDPLSATIQALIDGRPRNPFGLLGPHRDGRGNTIIRAFQPDAVRAWVLCAADHTPLYELERRHDAGFFVGTVPDRKPPFPYRLAFTFPDGTRYERDDPYRFPSLLGELDLYLLGEGRHLSAFERLGAHPTNLAGVAGVGFAVWAPNAQRVSVVGDFNRWDGRVFPMRFHPGVGIWDIFLPELSAGSLYKFELIGAHGERLPLKADPYAFQSEPAPQTASLVHGLPCRHWQDRDWMASRSHRTDIDAPVSIYEVHLGSWVRPDDPTRCYLTYAELADRLIPYVADLGFTHLELMPITEYPFDGSWGYQPTGLFAPTARHGAPEDFLAFIDRCHGAGLGVIADWVPGHFPNDAHGLARFDGTALYEHADPRQGLHEDWGTLIYNYGRHEVANFLLTSALFWLDRCHIDGLRVDAVASMLYLDYSRSPDQWIPNKYGGNENLEAIAFLRTLNQTVIEQVPGTSMMAEESTAWPAVSRPTWAGGLGFSYKWNMGWMHDTLAYMREDPIHRRWRHDRLTFGLLYAFSEHFILPLSHDEVVHGKGSLLNKMPGDDWQKFANLRAYFAFMWTQPGKKLLFMGGEFGQWREWDHDGALDWDLLEQPRHRGMQTLIRDLNRLYRQIGALHEKDCDPQGFAWIDCHDNENSVIIYLRQGRDDADPILVVCNFTPVVRDEYRFGVPFAGGWQVILNTDAAVYGGSDVGPPEYIQAEAVECHARAWSVRLTLPPLATMVLRRRP